MSDAPLIDPAILDDMVEAIGLDALRPVIDLFLDEAQRLSVAILDHAAAAPDGNDAVRRAAHSLKSSAGQLGAAALSEAAAAAERAAEEGSDLTGPAQAVGRLAPETIAAFRERLAAE